MEWIAIVYSNSFQFLYFFFLVFRTKIVFTQYHASEMVSTWFYYKNPFQMDSIHIYKSFILCFFFSLTTRIKNTNIRFCVKTISKLYYNEISVPSAIHISKSKKKMYEIEEENWKSKIYEKNSNI